ncbi:MAG: response regulator [Mucilaginibacter sp.]|nr:response regulator [Mucilaginibacter sp.]
MNTDTPTKVFVIDDNPLDNSISKLLLRRFDHQMIVEMIDCGAKAIDRLTGLTSGSPEELPDYIFVDLNMPEMDGWQFIKAFLRSGLNKYKKTKIYILSSSVNQEDLSASYQHELVQDFINKPLSLQTINRVFS